MTAEIRASTCSSGPLGDFPPNPAPVAVFPTPVVEAINSYRAAQHELDELTGLIADPATDAEMRAIADAIDDDRVSVRRYRAGITNSQ